MRRPWEPVGEAGRPGSDTLCPVMAKTKQPPARRPVKARGALPSPRVAPQRDLTPWHGKTGIRIVMAVVALALIGFIVNLVMDARDRAADRRQEARSVEQFERRVTDLNQKNSAIYEQLSQVPGAFLAGVLPVEEYRKATEGWVTSFRELNQGIRNLEAPNDFERLVEAKASYVQGTTLYIDAAKVFVAAAAIADPAEREKATVLGRNLFLHGTSVYAEGDRSITVLKNEYELNDPPAPVPEPAQPEEEVQLPPAPAAPVAPVDPMAPGTSIDPAAPGTTIEPAPAPPAAPVAPPAAPAAP